MVAWLKLIFSLGMILFEVVVLRYIWQQLIVPETGFPKLSAPCIAGFWLLWSILLIDCKKDPMDENMSPAERFCLWVATAGIAVLFKHGFFLGIH